MNPGATEPRSRRALYFLVGLVAALLALLAGYWRASDHADPLRSAPSGVEPEVVARDVTAPHSGSNAADSVAKSEREIASTVPDAIDVVDESASLASEEPWVVTGIAFRDEQPASLTEFEWIVLPIRIDGDGQELVAGTGPKGSVTTTESGRFEMRMKRPNERKTGFHELTLSGTDAQGRVRLGCVESPRCDVGIVRLAGPQPLVRGIVVDVEGRPISGVFVSLVDRAHEMGTDVARTGVLPRATTGADGRFDLRGHSRASKLTLWANHFDYESEVFENLPVPNGEMRVVLTHSPRPLVRVKVVRDPSACSEGIMVWLHHPTLQAERFWMLPIAADLWELPGLIPGRCDIEITACGVSVAKFDGVDVPPTGPALDPRLEGVDLRGRLECIAIQLVSKAGAAIPQGRISVGGWTHVAGEDGRIALVRPIGARITAVDCDGVDVELVDGMKFCAAL